MSFSSLLIHNCTTQRYTEGAADAYGNPTLTWNNHLTDEPCRLISISGREVKIGAELVVADYKLFTKDVDITEQDRVSVGGLTYEVLLVEKHSDSLGGHHKEALLRISR